MIRRLSALLTLVGLSLAATACSSSSGGGGAAPSANAVVLPPGARIVCADGTAPPCK
jgi:hypothetical protein